MTNGDLENPGAGADARIVPERIPLAQAFFDNIFLLLVLGLAVPIIFYTIWGLLEIASIPLAPVAGSPQ